MKNFAPNSYGPVFGPLLQTDRRRPLGAGARDSQATERLRGVTIESALAHATLADADMARCCLAGLWLLHDQLDASHAISQQIETPTGSFWHAIMHRREGDFGNSKYWFRRVGRHEVFASINERVAELAAARDAAELQSSLVEGGEFDPFALVDLVEAVERGRWGDARDFCLDIQQAEWERLFDWCYRRATGQ